MKVIAPSQIDEILYALNSQIAVAGGEPEVPGLADRSGNKSATRFRSAGKLAELQAIILFQDWTTRRISRTFGGEKIWRLSKDIFRRSNGSNPFQVVCGC